MLLGLGCKNKNSAFLKYRAFYFTTTRFEDAKIERNINDGFAYFTAVCFC